MVQFKAMNYILFDDHPTWKKLLPLTFTRPVSELRTGILSIREKWERMLTSSCSWLTQPHLREKYPVITAGVNVLIDSSLLPDKQLLDAVISMKPGSCLVAKGRLIACCLDGKGLENFTGNGTGPEKRTEYGADPECISGPWDLFSRNAGAIESDIALLTSGRKSHPLNETNTIIGPGRVFAEEGVAMDGVTLNVRKGTIYLGRDSEVMEGSVIRGPFALGEHSVIKMNAKIYGPVTIGPHSKAGGEISNSVLLGYSNKAHDGFLGNSVVGEWCNIGAGSNNSNLKNNYTTVRMWSYEEEKFIETGRQFMGLVMGDHSKCGINTMFNTGTTVGVFANIFGSGFPRNFIPSFSWGGPAGFTTYRLEKAFEVAEKVMERRKTGFGKVERDILESVFRMTSKYRR